MLPSNAQGQSLDIRYLADYYSAEILPSFFNMTTLSWQDLGYIATTSGL